MLTGKIFMNGRSQAVRLPKECRFDTNEVFVKKIGNIVLLLPKDNIWETAWDALDMFSDDFLEERNQPQVQIREDL